MKLIKWIKLKWRKLTTSKYIEINIPKDFKSIKNRNRFLIETKKHIVNITKIQE